MVRQPPRHDLGGPPRGVICRYAAVATIKPFSEHFLGGRHHDGQAATGVSLGCLKHATEGVSGISQVVDFTSLTRHCHGHLGSLWDHFRKHALAVHLHLRPCECSRFLQEMPIVGSDHYHIYKNARDQATTPITTACRPTRPERNEQFSFIVVEHAQHTRV